MFKILETIGCHTDTIAEFKFQKDAEFFIEATRMHHESDAASEKINKDRFAWIDSNQNFNMVQIVEMG